MPLTRRHFFYSAGTALTAAQATRVMGANERVRVGIVGEDRFAPQPDFARNPRGRLRIVVCRMDRALSLETSRCRRTLTASGSLTEVVRLDGIRGGLTHAELEEFVQSFPVQRG